MVLIIGILLFVVGLGITFDVVLVLVLVMGKSIEYVVHYRVLYLLLFVRRVLELLVLCLVNDVPADGMGDLGLSKLVLLCIHPFQFLWIIYVVLIS